jgi:WD40 repeat protein
VKTDRGSFLVEAEGPNVEVKSDANDLIIIRGVDEYRLKLDSGRADPNSRDPLLTIRRDGKAIITARRIPTVPVAPPTMGGPGRTVLNPKALASVWSLATTPDGKTLVSGHQGVIRVWDLATLAERYNVPIGRNGRRVAITPDGLTLASAEFGYINGKAIGNIVIRDGKTGAKRREMKPVESIHGVAIDKDGKVAVSSCWGEAGIRVWDVDTGDQVGTLKGQAGAIGPVVMSPDGKTLASGGYDNTVRLWDVDTGEVRMVFKGHEAGVESVAFSADGKRIASGGFDDDARVWDVETGKCLATFECENPVLTVAISPDGKTVATASARWGDGFYGQAPATVKTWDVATAKPLITLPEQPAQVFAMLFQPDGKTLITGNLGGAVLLWDLAAFSPAKDAPKPAR